MSPTWAGRGRMRRSAAAAVLVLVLGLGLAGCGGSSTVAPGQYVKSICTALGGWKQQIQSAGQTLQSSGVATASPANAKAQYLRFVTALLSATRRTTSALRAAGTPAVKNGATIAGDLSGGFASGSQGLQTAYAHASAIPTGSVSAFESAATVVTGELRTALAKIASITPRSSPQLRAAAVREPSCQALAK